MMKKKREDLVLEEYIDDDYYAENFYSVDNNSKKLSEEEEEYNNFFKVDNDYSTNYDIYVDANTEDDYDTEDDESDEEEDPAYTYDSSSPLYKFLSLFLVVFKWLGIAIAVVLIAYFITQGKIKSLLLYILGLVVAFFFGYFFMFLLNRFTED